MFEYIFSLELILLVGFISFLALSVIFFVMRRQNKNFTAAYLVMAVTALSYLLMLDGSVIAHASSGEPIYYTRWLFYAISCSLLMLTIIKFLKIKKESALPIIVLNVLVMATGTIAAVIDEPYKWMMFALGCIFFLQQLMLIFEKCTNSTQEKMVKTYIFCGWAIFPIVFVLAPEGLGIINNLAAMTIYLVLDIFTKVIFYLHISDFEKKS